MTAPPRSVRDWPLAAALALLTALAAGLAGAMLRATGGHLVYPLDDTYIQMAIAKNLAAHGTWGVTRFEFSGAGSSLLWPPLVAAVNRLSGLGARVPLVLNLLAAVLVVVLADRVLKRHVVHRWGRAAALAMVVVATPLAALSLVGMEHTLECAAALGLTAAGLALCRAEPSRRMRLMAVAALLACVTVAVRYDAGALVFAVGGMIAVELGWPFVAPIAIGSALPPAAYAAMAWRHGWPWLPAPVLLKQRLWGVDVLSWHGAADVLGGGALTVLVDTPALLVLVLMALTLVVTDRSDRDDRPARESRWLLLVFLVAAAVHLQFGRVGWLYRYEAYLILLGVIANASALARQLTLRRRRLDAVRWAGAAALAVVMVHPLLLRAFLASREVVTSAADLYRHDYVWSRFFQRYPPDGGLLVGDVGAVSYFTDVPIVDAGGLATRELLPARWTDPVDVGLAVRAARARGVRVSLIDGPGGGPWTGWQCVAAWTTVPDPGPNATLWLTAADDEAASHLERDLRTFAAEHQGGFTLAFAGERRDCRVPR